ncbi:hypothetical protein GCM10009801_68150 [Streptomyces albiaxialis]|uniref:Uncharacterized protein n=2 Tax=Streptomyces albiaxialis TaxID=329523 RepID=A0ABN2WSU5_9ACTN
MTVEIGYALVSGGFLGGVAFGVVVAPLLVWSPSGSAKSVLVEAGCAVGGLVALAWVVRVLVRFDRERRLGD